MVEELKTRLGGLPSPDEAEGIWTDIWYHEAHSSTALEGNTLVLREVEVLLREGKAVGSKELKDYLEVSGYAAAAQWVYSQALSSGPWTSRKLLTLTEVRHVHRLAMTPVWEVAPHPNASEDEGPGNWRRHDIVDFKHGMKPPNHPEVPALMRDWVDGVASLPRESLPVAQTLAAGHAALERIHPFIDGNGRIGRLLMNLLLVRLGYPPAIIQKRLRDRYLDALDRADRGDPGPLGEIIARAILDNLSRFVLPAVAGPAKLVPLESLASKDLSVVALRNAAQRSRLKALRAEDGFWRSSRQWVDEYRRDRYATLRLPRKRGASTEKESQ
ncbi:MAG TPA: Fic family protein [Candidatus Baltobacterales bacterium]|nr:Fic family protein [Candidatus Baltobacterales bacterium]